MNNLRELRIEAGVSLSILAVSTGMSKQNLSSLEIGKTNPKLKTAYHLAKVLNKSVYDIWPDKTEIIEETIIIRRVKSTDNRSID